MNKRVVLLFAIGAALTCSSARAQEKGQIGITMGYPESIGLMWHVTESVAVRPEFSFRHTSSNVSDDSTGVGVGISGLLYFTKEDAFRMYVSPRFTYFRATSSFNPSLALADVSLPGSLTAIGLPPPVSFDSTTTTKSVSGSFGAQYALHKRFSVFGEVGLRYSWTDFAFDNRIFLSIAPDGPRLTGTATAAGVIVYFKD